MEQLSIIDEVLNHLPPQFMDNGDGIVLGGGGPIEEEPEADNEPGINQGTTVSIGAPIRANKNCFL
jgi:hypothetical protein